MANKFKPVFPHAGGVGFVAEYVQHYFDYVLVSGSKNDKVLSTYFIYPCIIQNGNYMDLDILLK